jgi:hypothetical protein
MFVGENDVGGDELFEVGNALGLYKTGSSIAARMAMMAMTTRSSIRVKAGRCLRVDFISR